MEIFIPSRRGNLKRFEKPVFIVGCGNSGTTILWKALQRHPAFSAPPMEGQDLKDMPQCMKHFIGSPTYRLFSHSKFKDAYHLTERDYDPVVAERLASVYADHLKPRTRFIEKSPANSMRVRFLQSVFPDASFIIVIRNGVAVSEGIRRKRWYDPDRQSMAGLPTAITDAAEHWSRSNQTLLRDRTFLKKVMTVRYEDLVQRTRETLQSVLDFCECDGPITAPVFQDDLNAQQIIRLNSSELSQIHQIAGPTLRALGYLRPYLNGSKSNDDGIPRTHF